MIVAREARIRLRYVLKHELRWDPCLDIVGWRLPNAFVRRGAQDTAGDVADGAQQAARRKHAAPLAHTAEPPASQDAAPTYLPYPRALHHLMQRISASPEELAAWIWLGPDDGGLAAFVNANELDPPPRFAFPEASVESDPADHDYLSPLME